MTCSSRCYRVRSHSADRKRSWDHELGLDHRHVVPYRANSSPRTSSGHGAVCASRPRRRFAMLIALWSPKGGSGTSVLAASRRARARPGRLVRVPAGRSRRRPTRDLRARRRTRARAARLAGGGAGDAHGGARPPRWSSGSGVALLPLGGPVAALTAQARAVAGAALAVALRDGPMPVIVDCGRAADRDACRGRSRRRNRRRRPRLLPHAATRGAGACARLHDRNGDRRGARSVARPP